MDGLILDRLISLSHSLSHSHSHSLSHSRSHTLIHEGGGASRPLHTGGGRLRRPPPCVEAERNAASFMDECVAVAVAEAVAVAVNEAVAEADQSIHDQSIHEPNLQSL